MTATCWAEAIGGCSSKQSREHYISKTLFDGPKVLMRGLPWCQDADKSVGKAALTAKILCTSHNEGLSVLDAHAGETFRHLRESSDLEARRAAQPVAHWAVRRTKINGPVLERWFLKTLIDLACVHQAAPTWPGGFDRLHPPRQLVEACFGLHPLPQGHGLRAVAGIGHRLEFRDYVSFAPLMRAGTAELAAGLFEFRGFRFVMSIVDDDLEPVVRGLAEVDESYAGWRDAAFLFPLKAIRMERNGRLSQEIRFVWPPFMQGKRRRLTHALRRTGRKK